MTISRFQLWKKGRVWIIQGRNSNGVWLRDTRRSPGTFKYAQHGPPDQDIDIGNIYTWLMPMNKNVISVLHPWLKPVLKIKAVKAIDVMLVMTLKPLQAHF